ncbi:MAG: hypothetical protein WCG83_05420 [Candidatus Peregrinibacteria bacterium]
MFHIIPVPVPTKEELNPLAWGDETEMMECAHRRAVMARRVYLLTFAIQELVQATQGPMRVTYGSMNVQLDGTDEEAAQQWLNANINRIMELITEISAQSLQRQINHQSHDNPTPNEIQRKAV